MKVKPNCEEVRKLLDNGWSVTICKNQLGSYFAFGFRPCCELTPPIEQKQITLETDDFTIAKALHRLADKLTGTITEFEDEPTRNK